MAPACFRQLSCHSTLSPIGTTHLAGQFPTYTWPKNTLSLVQPLISLTSTWLLLPSPVCFLSSLLCYYLASRLYSTDTLFLTGFATPNVSKILPFFPFFSDSSTTLTLAPFFRAYLSNFPHRRQGFFSFFSFLLHHLVPVPPFTPRGSSHFLFFLILLDFTTLLLPLSLSGIFTFPSQLLLHTHATRSTSRSTSLSTQHPLRRHRSLLTSIHPSIHTAQTHTHLHTHISVSYTHLTLPTICSV